MVVNFMMQLDTIQSFTPVHLLIVLVIVMVNSLIKHTLRALVKHWMLQVHALNLAVV